MNTRALTGCEDVAATIAARPLTSWRFGFGPVTLRTFGSYVSSPWTLVFMFGMPIIMYLMFGTNQSYTSIAVGHGNVSAVILVSLTQYAAAVSAAQIAASIAIDYIRGLSRTWALTPLGVQAWVATKLVVALLMTAIVTAVLFGIGAAIEAQMEPAVWAQTYLLTAALTTVPAMIGTVTAALIRSEDAYGMLGGGMAILSFLSGMFIPLDQLGTVFQTIAKFTPLWGINILATTPLAGWDSLEWEPVANLVSWLVLLVAAAAFTVRRMTTR